MSQLGVIRKLTASYERIAAAIRTIPKESFTSRELHVLLPDVAKGTVNAFLSTKSRAGWLQRVGRAAYRIGGVRIRTPLPHSLVAEAVWAVLHTDPERKPRLLREVTEDAESFVNRSGVRLYYDVNNTLRKWTKSGAVERTGGRREYRYRLRDGVTERPLS